MKEERITLIHDFNGLSPCMLGLLQPKSMVGRPEQTKAAHILLAREQSSKGGAWEGDTPIRAMAQDPPLLLRPLLLTASPHVIPNNQ